MSRDHHRLPLRVLRERQVELKLCGGRQLQGVKAAVPIGASGNQVLDLFTKAPSADPPLSSAPFATKSARLGNPLDRNIASGYCGAVVVVPVARVDQMVRWLDE